MTALGDDMGLLAGESKAEAQRLETDGTLLLVVCRLVRRYDWGRGHWDEERDVDVDKRGASTRLRGMN